MAIVRFARTRQGLREARSERRPIGPPAKAREMRIPACGSRKSRRRDLPGASRAFSSAGVPALVVDVVCVSDGIAARLGVLEHPLQAHEEPDEVVVVGVVAVVGPLTPLGEFVAAE